MGVAPATEPASGSGGGGGDSGGCVAGARNVASARPAMGNMFARLHARWRAAEAAEAAAAAAHAARRLAPPTCALHIRLCDNHYPFSMQAFNELQAALHATEAATAIAAAAAGATAAAPAAEGATPPAEAAAEAVPLVLLELVRWPGGDRGGSDGIGGFPGGIGGFPGNFPGPFPALPLSLPGGPVAAAAARRESRASASSGAVHHSAMPSHLSGLSDDSAAYGCAVCFDNPNQLTVKHCGHKLCVPCYRQLVRPCRDDHVALCPFCRAPILGFEYRSWVRKPS
uniref:RING-type domain-containing protein n=1 Tax=Chlamydomonas euryale TaxID=1486919 RepID=A0A7R9VJK4_9CHLO